MYAVFKEHSDCKTVKAKKKFSFFHSLFSLFFFNLAATYSPVPSPAKYHRPLKS